MKYKPLRKSETYNAAYNIAWDKIDELCPDYIKIINEINEYAYEVLKKYYGDKLFNFILNNQYYFNNYYLEPEFGNVSFNTKGSESLDFDCITFAKICFPSFIRNSLGDKITIDKDEYKVLKQLYNEYITQYLNFEHIIDDISETLYKLKSYKRVNEAMPYAIPYIKWHYYDDNNQEHTIEPTIVHDKNDGNINEHYIHPKYLYEVLDGDAALTFLKKILPPISDENIKQYKGKRYRKLGYTHVNDENKNILNKYACKSLDPSIVDKFNKICMDVIHQYIPIDIFDELQALGKKYINKPKKQSFNIIGINRQTSYCLSIYNIVLPELYFDLSSFDKIFRINKKLFNELREYTKIIKACSEFGIEDVIQNVVKDICNYKVTTVIKIIPQLLLFLIINESVPKNVEIEKINLKTFKK